MEFMYDYIPKELQRRSLKAREREQTRLIKEEMAMENAEKKQRVLLKKFLTEENGQRQLQEMVKQRGFTPGLKSLGTMLGFHRMTNTIRQSMAEMSLGIGWWIDS